MPVSEIIKKLRNERKLTQIDLANQINCKRQKIADWERGKSYPSIKDLILLCKIFNVSADYLLGLCDVMTADRDIKFICDYTGLNEEAVESIRKLLSVAENKEDIVYHLLGEVKFIRQFVQ